VGGRQRATNRRIRSSPSRTSPRSSVLGSGHRQHPVRAAWWTLMGPPGRLGEPAFPADVGSAAGAGPTDGLLAASGSGEHNCSPPSTAGPSGGPVAAACRSTPMSAVANRHVTPWSSSAPPRRRDSALCQARVRRHLVRRPTPHYGLSSGTTSPPSGPTYLGVRRFRLFAGRHSDGMGSPSNRPASTALTGAGPGPAQQGATR
jgi:hypothetical protein